MHRLRRHLMGHLAGSPFGPGGRFFGAGEVRLALLSLLGDSAAHGYQLMTRLEERCRGAYQASAGTIYPTLQQLEDEGLVKVSASQTKKTYELTADGKKELERRAQELSELWRRADARSEWGVLNDPDAAEILGPALRLAKAALKAVVKSRGDAAMVDAVREVLEDARDRIESLPRRRR
jgi:DNA-binding PadR family transcriptional regulator